MEKRLCLTLIYPLLWSQANKLELNIETEICDMREYVFSGADCGFLFIDFAGVKRKSCKTSNSAVKLIIKPFLTSDESDVIGLSKRP